MIAAILAQATAILAQASGTADSVGISITSLIGSMGAAGAAVVVTYYFIGFLKDQGDKQNKLLSDFRDYHGESQRKFQDQLDKLSDRQELSQRSFQEQITRVAGQQNEVIQNVVVALKGMEGSISGLQVGVRGLETIVHRIVEIDVRPRRATIDGDPSRAIEGQGS